MVKNGTTPWGSKERAIALLSLLLLMMYDLMAVLAAMVLAVILRFEYLRTEYLTAHIGSLPVVLATYLITFYCFRLYRHQWQYAGVEVLGSVLMANVVAALISFFWHAHFDGADIWHWRSITVMTCLLATALVGGQRVLLRVLSKRRGRGKNVANEADARWTEEPKRTVILGGGQPAVEVLAALGKETTRRYEVIGILDDNPRTFGTYLRGVKILGGLDTLHTLLHRHAVDEAIIALPSADGERLRELVLNCCRHKVAVRVLPVIAELLENPSASRGRLRAPDLSVEDLLHRPSAQADLSDTGRYLTGQRILVTGAGGSIGSEICRQISKLDPEMLILLGHGENSIHAIELELLRMAPSLAGRLTSIICDIRHMARLQYQIARFRPQMLFHAAAHKHVPMMEGNIAEAILNNVGGTRNVIQAAVEGKIERMVLISTDKAVNPSSVMGATKFLCEELAVAEAQRGITDFVTVRFGNVLGSRGSVLPTFQEQILHGGPVTITHPEVSRYFMTIPEAASLVIEAGARGDSGNLFVLNMGRPIRILDLAEDLIRLFGLEPYRDIDITFCGLRPGEKLMEELFTEREQRHASLSERLYIVERPHYHTPDGLAEAVNQLLAIAATNDDQAVLTALPAAVPTFHRSEVAGPTG